MKGTEGAGDKVGGDPPSEDEGTARRQGTLASRRSLSSGLQVPKGKPGRGESRPRAGARAGEGTLRRLEGAGRGPAWLPC